MASYNNKNNDSPFRDSSEFGSGQSRYEYSTQPHQPTHQAQHQDLIDLQHSQTHTASNTSFSNSTSSSTLNPQQPAFTHQANQPLKRNDSSFADEGKKIKKKQRA